MDNREIAKNYPPTKSVYLSLSWFMLGLFLVSCYRYFTSNSTEGITWLFEFIVSYLIVLFMGICISLYYRKKTDQYYKVIYYIKYLYVVRGTFSLLATAVFCFTLKQYSTNTWIEWAIGLTCTIIIFITRSIYRHIEKDIAIRHLDPDDFTLYLDNPGLPTK